MTFFLGTKTATGRLLEEQNSDPEERMKHYVMLILNGCILFFNSDECDCETSLWFELTSFECDTDTNDEISFNALETYFMPHATARCVRIDVNEKNAILA